MLNCKSDCVAYLETGYSHTQRRAVLALGYPPTVPPALQPSIPSRPTPTHCGPSVLISLLWRPNTTHGHIAELMHLACVGMLDELKGAVSGSPTESHYVLNWVPGTRSSTWFVTVTFRKVVRCSSAWSPEDWILHPHPQPNHRKASN